MKECLICKQVFGDHIERCDRDRSPLKFTLPGLPIINNIYRLDERIGHGSLGIVYRGARIGQPGPLAIKIIHPEFCQADANIASILWEETEAVKRVNHSNIVRVLDYGHSNNDSLYIVMEHLTGCTLQSLIEQEPEIAIERAIELMDQICDAIATMHNLGRLHWELKPGNIFIVYGGNGNEQIKVADFGLSRVKTMELCNYIPGARTQNLLSLPYYFSPEQCDGQEINARSEVYSLGVIFYQLLTGQVPFKGNSYLQILNQHISQAPVSPRSLRRNIPEAIEAILLRALAKSPQERFPSPSAFATMLKMTVIQPSSRRELPHIERSEDQPLANQALNNPVFNNQSLNDPNTVDHSISQPANINQSGAHRRKSDPPTKTYPVVERSPSAFFNETGEEAITEPTSSRHAGGREILDYMARLLDNSIVSSSCLSASDIDPDTLVTQIADQIEQKRVQQDNEYFVPSLITVYVPRTNSEKFKELESIFNSMIFVGNIYKYVRKMDYRLFNLLKVEVEMVGPQLNISQPQIVISWPSANDVSSGLEKIVEIEHEQRRVISTQFPAIEIPRIALLQPINASAYHDQFLIVRSSTHLGRFRNVIDHASGQLLRRNDLAFLQPIQPESPNNSISRQHAQIQFIDGEFYFFDTGSTNGSRVNRRENGTRVQYTVESMGKGVLLRDRDIIQMGLALVSFEIVPPSKIASMADEVCIQNGFQLPAPGSTADIFRTAVITTSLTTALVW